jgi:hypothetical protein
MALCAGGVVGIRPAGRELDLGPGRRGLGLQEREAMAGGGVTERAEGPIAASSSCKVL